MLAVVKIGTSSITDERGDLDDAAILKLCGDLAAAHAAGHRLVLVLSGAIAAGMPALGLTTRPTDIGTLQALAAVGQPRLVERLNAIFSTYDIVGGQVLLTPYDFVHRSQYLHARETLQKLLDLGVLPIVNENDTVADDEIRYGDNDRLAALVSHLLHADALVMLTDTAGLFTADPKHDRRRVADRGDRRGRRRARTARGRRRHGAGERRDGEQARGRQDRRVVGSARGDRGRDRRRRRRRRARGKPVGTAFAPRAQRLSSRKLWIAFAQGAQGRIVVDDGARNALVSAGRSLLAAGVRAAEGNFDADAAVEIVGRAGRRVRQGPQPLLGVAARARSPAAARPTSPTGCPTRSSTATTSSCCRSRASARLVEHLALAPSPARRMRRPPDSPARYLMRSCECVIGSRLPSSSIFVPVSRSMSSSTRTLTRPCTFTSSRVARDLEDEVVRLLAAAARHLEAVHRRVGGTDEHLRRQTS